MRRDRGVINFEIQLANLVNSHPPPILMDKFVLVDLPSIKRVVYHLVFCPSDLSFLSLLSQISASVVRVLAQARTLPSSPDMIQP